MLIENSLGEFSDAQALTASAASTNYLDLELEKHNAGQAPLWLWLICNVAASFADTDETYLFAFMTDTDSGFATNPRAELVIADVDGSAIALADPEDDKISTAGLTIYAGTLPYGCQRYGRWYYTLGGTTPTITVDALLLAGPPPQNRSGDQIYESDVSTI